MFSVDIALLGFVAGSLIPLVTGLITKATAKPGLKAFISAALSALTAVVTALTKSAGVGNWKESLLLFFTTWIAHAGVYFGFLKPTGVAGAVQGSTDKVGIG